MVSGRQRRPERHLTEAELDEAIASARSDGDPHLLQRLCFLKNCYAGDTATEAANRVGVSRSTGSRWLDRWNDGGMEALRPGYGGGRPTKLDADERERLGDRLAADGPWTTAAVGRVLREEFDVEYAPGYLPRLLRSLGLSYARADEIDGASDVRQGGEGSEGDRPALDGRTPLVGYFE